MPSSNCSRIVNLSCQIVRSNLKHLDKSEQKNSEPPTDKALALQFARSDVQQSGTGLASDMQPVSTIGNVWLAGNVFSLGSH